MKKIIYLVFALITTILSSCSDQDSPFDEPDINLVPVYSVLVEEPSASNNTTSGYKSVVIPSKLEIFKEKEYIVHFVNSEIAVPIELFTNESLDYVAATTDPVTTAQEGKLKYTYNIKPEDVVTEFPDKTITVEEVSEYALEIKTTDIDGNGLENISGLGLTVTKTNVVTTVVDKVDGDVDVPEVVVPATDDEGEITTVVTVDATANKTTTKITTVASAISEVVVNETQIYN